MVIHPLLESQLLRRRSSSSRGLDFLRARAARDPRHRRGVRVEADRARAHRALPRPPAVRRGRPGRLAQEGSTPLVHAPRGQRAGRRRGVAEARGREPDGLVQGPRHDVRGRRTRSATGAEAVICASTGNTAASLAAYAARAGIGGAVIVPEGKIAAGKLAQALMHGARVIALRGNFDEALELVRELTRRHPIALVNSRQPVPARGPEDGGVRDRRGARRGSTRCASRSATPATSPPTGRASGGRAARRGCSASRPRAPRRSCSAAASRSPRRSRARSGSATRRAGRRRWRR